MLSFLYLEKFNSQTAQKERLAIHSNTFSALSRNFDHPFCYDKASGVEVLVCLLRQRYYGLDRGQFATTKLVLLAAERMWKQFHQLDDCFK